MDHGATIPYGYQAVYCDCGHRVEGFDQSNLVSKIAAHLIDINREPQFHGTVPGTVRITAGGDLNREDDTASRTLT